MSPDDLAGLANWQLGDCDEADSEFIASLRDDIFAAIEAYRSAEAAFIARSEYEDAVGLCNASEQTPEMKATVKSDIAARVELANTAPTTLAGLVAYLDYVVVESEKLSSEDCPMFLFAGEEETLDFVRSLRRSATALAAQSWTQVPCISGTPPLTD
jgi:hypothetical protein